MTTAPLDQSRYQLRFDWGLDGLARLAPADVVVVVDVLPSSPAVADAVAEAAAAGGAVVLQGGLRNATAVAHAVLAEQRRRGARTSVNLVAAGEPAGAGLRFAVEDQLGAGAVLGALEALGIDHTSPEAAAASESFRGLRLAVRHLLTASASGQQLIDAGARDEALHAAQLDATASVRVLRDGIWSEAATD